MSEFNGYNFDVRADRTKMRYLVVLDGALDINNAYAFKSKKELLRFIKDGIGREILAVFKVEDITDIRAGTR